MKKRIFITFIFLLIFSTLYSLTYRIYDHSSFTRLVFEDDQPFTYHIEDSGTSIKITINTKKRFSKRLGKLKSKRLKFLNFQRKNGKVYITLEKKGDFTVKNFVLESPYRVVLDFTPASEKKNIAAHPKQFKISTPQETNYDSSNFQKEKKREIRVIVIDPGHGGSEYGAVGPSGTFEKDITLAIAKKLKQYIENNIGIKVYLTRDKDMDLSLEDRAAIANNHKADMFISIHCNASRSKKARGSETYILSLKATDKEARRLAFFENNFKEMQDDVGDNSDLSDIKLILWDMAQTEYLKESAVLAEYIQNELNLLLGTKDRGIKQAPFRVLMNVAMPAVLVETAFISNKNEEEMLKDPDKQRKIAYAIFLGIKRYIVNN